MTLLHGKIKVSSCKNYTKEQETESLKQLKQMADEKGSSFLYIAPNTKPVVQTCIDLGLTCYQDIGHGVADISSDGQPIHRSRYLLPIA